MRNKLPTSCRGSVLLLSCLILVVFAFGRLVSINQEKTQKVDSYQRVLFDLSSTNQQLREQVNELQKENTQLKKQSSLPVKQKIADYIKQVFGVHYQEAYAVQSCENSPDNPHYDPMFVHLNSDGTKDYGVFQINGKTWVPVYGEKLMSDWKTNIETAFKIYQHSGWRDWYSSESCWKDKVAMK